MHFLGLFIVVASLIISVVVQSVREVIVTAYSLAPEITILTFVGFFYPIFLYLYSLVRKTTLVSRDFFKSQVTLASSLCVSLGLMGTFIGLAQMVSSIASGMNADGDFSAKIAGLLAAIGLSLDSMSLAFLTSIIGVGASTVLVVACNYIALYFPSHDSEENSKSKEALSPSSKKSAYFDADLLAEKLSNAIASSPNFNQISVLASVVSESNQIQSEVLASLLRMEKSVMQSDASSSRISSELMERFVCQDVMSSQILELTNRLDVNFQESINMLGESVKNISGFSGRLIDEVAVIGNSINRITYAVEVQENSSIELRDYIKNLVDKQKINVADLVEILSDLKYLLLPPLEEDLKLAIEQDSLDLKFHPRYDLKKDVRGFEVLLYWNHPVRGEVENSEIFESKISNDIELLKSLDQWVVAKSFQKLSAWIRTDVWNPNWVISLNITPAYIEDLSLLGFLRSMVEKYRIPPHYVAIEIKETSFVSKPEIIQQQVYGIQEIGMEVYVDNYGMEAASLVKFRRMGITRLKVDKVITQCLADEVDAPSELRAILASANQLTFEIIADGVERDIQYAHLKKVGFDLFQGNYLSKPINDVSELSTL